MIRTEFPAIIFEDDDLLVFNKPAGLLVIPDRWDKKQANLLDMVHLKISLDCFNVHRIDKDTSGICVFGKSRESIRLMSRQFGSHSIRKEYLALTVRCPQPERGRINASLLFVAAKPSRMVVASAGKPSITDYETVEIYTSGFALVRLNPVTGRTHQIRAHLSHLKCPVLSDPLYGTGRALYLSDIKKSYKRGMEEEKPLIARTALHAASIRFMHPTNQRMTEINAALPKDMLVTIRQLRKI